MNPSKKSFKTLSGGCLCGQVRYQITGPRRSIIYCHCENCRRNHGHLGAYTALRKQHLKLSVDIGLTWYHDAGPNIYRGFCQSCGSSLFWDARRGDEMISVSAGSLDAGHDLQAIAHIHVAEAGEYYDICDGLPLHQYSSDGVYELD